MIVTLLCSFLFLLISREAADWILKSIEIMGKKIAFISVDHEKGSKSKSDLGEEFKNQF